MDSSCVEFSNRKFPITWRKVSGYFWTEENVELFHDWVLNLDANRELRHGEVRSPTLTRLIPDTCF